MTSWTNETENTASYTLTPEIGGPWTYNELDMAYNQSALYGFPIYYNSFGATTAYTLETENTASYTLETEN